jgi:hypothetical protein
MPVKGALDVIHPSGDITNVYAKGDELSNISDSLILTAALVLGVGYKIPGAPHSTLSRC